MTKALKLISVAALVAATSTAALANDVPLNTKVSGGEGTEQLAGQAAGAAIALSSMGVIAGLTVITLIGSSSDDSSD